MSGGGGSPIAKVMGQLNGQAGGGRDSSMPAYGSQTISPSANKYTATYAPMQQTPQQNVQDMGLEALYQSMASQYAPISQQQNPMDQFYQGPIQQGRQMPLYGNSYRPDMSGITGNLNRVKAAVTPDQISSLDNYGNPIASPQPTYGGE